MNPHEHDFVYFKTLKTEPIGELGTLVKVTEVHKCSICGKEITISTVVKSQYYP